MEKEKTNKTAEQSNQKRTSLLIGASIFFFMVLYFNIRGEHKVEILDWIVIGIATILFIFALINKFKNKDRI